MKLESPLQSRHVGSRADSPQLDQRPSEVLFLRDDARGKHNVLPAQVEFLALPITPARARTAGERADARCPTNSATMLAVRVSDPPGPPYGFHHPMAACRRRKPQSDRELAHVLASTRTSPSEPQRAGMDAPKRTILPWPRAESYACDRAKPGVLEARISPWSAPADPRFVGRARASRARSARRTRLSPSADSSRWRGASGRADH